MNNSPKIPLWAGGVAAALVVLVAAFFLMKGAGGDGPRDPSTYPKEAFHPPAYTPPAGTYTRDGKPVSGPGGGPGSPGTSGPGYPQRPQ